MKKIKVVSFVCGESCPVPVETLDAEKREALSRWLRETYLTELCRGKAEVSWRPE